MDSLKISIDFLYKKYYILNMESIEKKHSMFSPSSCDRWFACPGSIKLIEDLKEIPQPNEYALEGTKAHELAHSLWKDKDFDTSAYNQEMVYFVKKYIEYLNSIIEDGSSIYIENKVYFNEYTPHGVDGFGSSDAIIVNNGVVKIVDFKYGRYTVVQCKENKQLMLYALGALKTFNLKQDIFELHIYQPRCQNISIWRISRGELLDFGDQIKKKIENALSDKPVFEPGYKQCLYCPAKKGCSELLKSVTKKFNMIENENLLKKNDTIEKNILPLDYKIKILKNEKLIISLIDDIKKELTGVLKEGKKIPGLKLVKKRSNRKLKDDAERTLIEKLGSKAYQTKLISIADLRKALNEEDFNLITYQSDSGYTVVDDGDRRIEVDLFKNLE